jgi:hypothetical protein
MGDLIKKIKSNFLGKNSFSVGFNNRSPVEGISRKASPLNGYTPASASFDGAKGAISSYGALMQSNYGNPEVPDNADLGKVLSEAVGKVGKAAGQLGAAYTEAEAGAEKGEGGGNWWNQRRSSKKSVSRKSSSPLNQDDEVVNSSDPVSTALTIEPPNTEIVVVDDDDDGGLTKTLKKQPTAEDLDSDENKTDQDKLIEFCTENPNHKLCTGRNVSKSWTDMTPTERINDPRLKWD